MPGRLVQTLGQPLCLHEPLSSERWARGRKLVDVAGRSIKRGGLGAPEGESTSSRREAVAFR